MTTATCQRSVPAVAGAPRAVDAQIAPAGARRARLTRVLSVGAAVAVLTYLAVTSWPSLVASLATLTHLQVGWVGPLLAAQLVSMAAPALVHHRLLRVRGTPVGVRTLLGITYASSALSVSLPLAGPEIATGYTFRQLVRRGVDSAAAGWTLLISGVASALTFTLLVIGSAAATGSSTAAALAVGTSLLIGATAVGLLRLLRHATAGPQLERAAARVAGVARRIAHRPLTDTVAPAVSFLRRLAEHRLGARDAAAVGGLALLNWVTDVLCLALAIAAVGADVPWTGLLLAYVAGTGVGALRLTPGGLGVVETAMAAGLITSGVDPPAAIAAVLLYRLVAYWLVLAAGWVTFLRTRQTNGQRLTMRTNDIEDKT